MIAEKPMRLAIHYALLAATIWIVTAVVWSMTGGPMLANYRECGTIFLCLAQK